VLRQKEVFSKNEEGIEKGNDVSWHRNRKKPLFVKGGASRRKVGKVKKSSARS